jgi:hypothetical protein
MSVDEPAWRFQRSLVVPCLLAVAAGCGAKIEGVGGSGAGGGSATPVANSGGAPGSGGTAVASAGRSTAAGSAGTTPTNNPPGGTDPDPMTPGAPTLTPLQDPKVTPVDPGRKTLHRLNNAEYNNTVRDLFGTSLRPADSFVADDRGAGFDNMADVLSLSATHLDMYATAARDLVEAALADGTQRGKLVPCNVESQGATCVRTALAAFMPRAWRRPVSDAEVDRFLAPANLAMERGESAEAGLSLSLRALLISSNFLFRVELDPSPTDLTPHALTNYELASRLSYFIWSSMPDTELFAAAEAGTLGDQAVLTAEVARMLQDPKAEALLQNFAGQWLGLRAIDVAEPDPQTFPGFDTELRSAMRKESESLFQEVIETGAPLKTLLLADFTYVNDRLARHYGLPAPGSSDLVRVSLAGNSERRGLLSHAGYLTVTSHPRYTSPVNRGKWVMDALMCQAIPPPPPDVNTATFGEEVDAGASLRERLEAHRADPTCAGCHSLMDPIGFGLENFDAIGAYRTNEDNGALIDASGQLPDGRMFSGAIELVSLLAGDPNFGRCVSQQLFTYALGRPPLLTDSTTYDPSTIDALTDISNAGSAFEALVKGIASSLPFTQRRGDSGAGGTP